MLRSSLIVFFSGPCQPPILFSTGAAFAGIAVVCGAAPFFIKQLRRLVRKILRRVRGEAEAFCMDASEVDKAIKELRGDDGEGLIAGARAAAAARAGGAASRVTGCAAHACATAGIVAASCPRSTVPSSPAAASAGSPPQPAGSFRTTCASAPFAARSRQSASYGALAESR